MKSIFRSFIALASLFAPSIALAQDLPEPVEESAADTAQNKEIQESAPANEAPAAAEDETTATPKTPQMLAAEELVAFFSGMNQAVQDAQGDCAAMSDAIQNYYESRRAWIDKLDYSTTSVDAETIDTIHNMAIEFGKTLSTCYDQKSIAEQLRKYAGLGEEW